MSPRRFAGDPFSLSRGVAIILGALCFGLVGPMIAPAHGQKDYSFGGDARFRIEDTFNREELDDRLRFRLRMRLWGTYTFLEERFAVGGRLTTGDPEDPNSPYQDLGSFFERFPFSLDRLYLMWRPIRMREGETVGHDVFVTGGKFAHPFAMNPVYGELVWDEDVQPEGVVASASRISRWTVGGSAGGYVLIEQSNNDDVRAFVGQGISSFDLTPNTKLSGALGIYEYADLAVGGEEALRRNRGNALSDSNGDGTPDAYTSSFRILDLITFLKTEFRGQRFIGSFQYVKNLGAGIPRDSGRVVGFATERDLSANSGWNAQYQYQEIEQDAVFSPMVQDDFVFATNFKGHLFGAAYTPVSYLRLRTWALVAKRLDQQIEPAAGYQWRVRFDFDVRF